MNTTHRFFALLLAFILMAGISSTALAQDQDHHLDDYSSTPLVQPTTEDFAPAPEPEVGPDGQPVVEAPIGVNGYFEISDKQKVFSLTPKYRFSPDLSVKFRVPIILERTRTYWNGEATASGLGDIALEGEFTHQFAGPSKLLRLQATIKLPTGDNENLEEGNVKVPLGTGSMDLMARAQFTRSTSTTGLLASALFRINASGEAAFQDTTMNPVQTTTITSTNGNEFVASLFGRHVVGQGIWLNLGASVMMTGNGDQETVYSTSGGTSSTFKSDLVQKSTLLDLYPGVSYRFGPVTPYLGARIPLSTSYDNTFLEEKRDTAYIFQLSYRPLRMLN